MLQQHTCHKPGSHRQSRHCWGCNSMKHCLGLSLSQPTVCHRPVCCLSGPCMHMGHTVRTRVPNSIARVRLSARARVTLSLRVIDSLTAEKVVHLCISTSLTLMSCTSKRIKGAVQATIRLGQSTCGGVTIGTERYVHTCLPKH